MIQEGRQSTRKPSSNDGKDNDDAVPKLMPVNALNQLEATVNPSSNDDDGDDDEVPLLTNVDDDDDDDDDDVPLLTNLNDESSPTDDRKNSTAETKNITANDDDDDDDDDEKIVPVTILTGFLGSGKTTLVRHILRSPDHGYRVAVIENEYADGKDDDDDGLALSGVEGLIARDGLGPNDGALVSLTELPNGCVCCSVRDSLSAALESLLRSRRGIDYVLIETSGMADPGPVAASLWSDDGLRGRSRLDGIVTLVDARNLERQLRDTADEGREAERQIAYADRTLINKTDLLNDAEDEDALERVVRTVRGINPTVPTRTTTYSRVPDLGWLLGADCLNRERLRRVMTGATTSAETPPPSSSSSPPPLPLSWTSMGRSCATCDPSTALRCRACGVPTHAHTTSVVTVTLVRPGKSVDLRKTHAWLAELLWPDQDRDNREIAEELRSSSPSSSTKTTHHRASSTTSRRPRVFRCKGVLSVLHDADEDWDGEDDDVVLVDDDAVAETTPRLDDRRFIVQAVHDLWEIRPASDDLRWKPDEERRCEMVFIGQWLDRDALKSGLEACFVDVDVDVDDDAKEEKE